MKPDIEELVRKALALDERDRVEVAARLLGSVEEEEDSETTGSSRSQKPSRPQPKRFETRISGQSLLEAINRAYEGPDEEEIARQKAMQDKRRRLVEGQW